MKSINSRSSKKIIQNRQRKGYGLIDYIVNKLPEIHIPGYQYCGPGTELQKRLARGDQGINKLDEACKDHDIAYSKIKSSTDRREADKALVARALPRIYSQDAKLGERAAALLVSGLMGAKIGLSKVGLGFKIKKKKRGSRRGKRRTIKSRIRRTRSKKKGSGTKKKNRSKKKQKFINFGKLINSAKTSIKKSKLKSSSLNDTIKAALRSVKVVKRNKTVKIPRVLKVPKFGGSILPILPIISALSAVGSISASTAAVIKAIKGIQNFNKHDISGESKKKIGRGLYLVQSATGSGFYLRPFHQQR